MTIFHSILCMLATKNVVPKSALFTLSPNLSPVYHQIERAKQLGLMREESYTKYDGDNQETIDYLMLTVDGLRYMRDECTDVIPWAGSLPRDLSGMSIIGSAITKERIATRFTGVAAAAIMAENIGAYNTNCFVSDAFGQIISGAMETTGVGAGSRILNGSMRFIPAPEMKKRLSKTDARSGRYSGMICGSDRSIIIYMASRLSPLIESRKSLAREHRAYDLFCRKYQNEDTQFPTRQGALLVPDPRSFAANYHLTQSIQKKAHVKDRLDLGAGYHRYWAIPLSWQGTQDFREIMTENVDDVRKRTVDLIAEADLYFKNSEVDEDLFPLTDGFDTWYAVEPLIDIRRLKRMEAKMRERPELEYGVICRHAHTPYFQAVLTDVEILELENELGYISTGRNSWDCLV